MINSQALLIGVIVFIVFGYISLIRICAKFFISDSYDASRSYFKGAFKADGLIQNIGQSLVFAALPATIIFLYWGWGPALLWLVAFHLVVESLINFQLSAGNTTMAEALFLKGIKRGTKTLDNRLLIWLWQSLLILIIAISVALFSKLMTQQSGVIFALIGLLAGFSVYHRRNDTMPYALNLCCALLLVLLGFSLAQYLGFSIYGSFAIHTLLPHSIAQNFAWLEINNPTIFALIVVISSWVLSNQTKLKNALHGLSGVLLIALLIGLCAMLAWRDLALDAPLNTVQVEVSNTPIFSSLCLFIAAGLLLHLFHPVPANNKEISKAHYFVVLQSVSFVQLLFLLAVFISMATAFGLGAWKTDFIDWTNTSHILNYFTLVQKNIFAVLIGNTQTQSEPVFYTVFISGLAFICFTLLITLMHRLRTAQAIKKRQPTFSEHLAYTKTYHLIIIYICSCFFINNGVAVYVWMLIGMFAWLLVTTALIKLAIIKQQASSAQRIQSALSLLILMLGQAQLISLAVSSMLDQNWLLFSTALIVACLGLFLWHKQIRLLFIAMRPAIQSDLFDK